MSSTVPRVPPDVHPGSAPIPDARLPYSLVLFAVAALVLTTVYVALARQVGDDPVSSARRAASLSAVLLGGLFLVSLGVGWYLSGRALRPVKRIAAADRRSRPAIRPSGSGSRADDEFRSLADADRSASFDTSLPT